MNTFKIHSALFIVALIQALNYPIAKQIMPYPVDPFAVIMIRIVVVAVLFWLSGLFVKEKIAYSDLWRILLCSFFGTSANILLFYKGLSVTSTANASLIMTTTPIMVLLIAAVILKEKITLLKIIGIALGLAGALLLIKDSFDKLNQEALLGDMMVFVNAVFYGIYLVIVKKLILKYHAITLFKWVFLAGVIMTLPFGLPALIDTSFASFTAQTWWVLAYIAILATFTTYVLNGWALRVVTPSVVGMYIYFQPLLAMFAAVLFFNEVFVPIKLLYGCMIFMGVYMVSKKTLKS